MEPDDLMGQLLALSEAYARLPGDRANTASLVLSTLWLCLFDPETPPDDLLELDILVSSLARRQIEARRQRAAPNN